MCGVGILRTTAVHQEVPEDGVELLWALPSVKGLLPAFWGILPTDSTEANAMHLLIHLHDFCCIWDSVVS